MPAEEPKDTQEVVPEGWHSADEAPKGIFELSRPSHIMRSKPIWLLQGAHIYREMNHEKPWENDGPEKTDPPKIVLGYCVWPLVRFIGRRKWKGWENEHDYEQWLATPEHYFVSLETDAEHIFPAQFWREIDVPEVPKDIVDDGYRWGTRHLGWFGASELEVGKKSQFLKNMRRAYTDNPFAEQE